jgi:hypothetical protein
MENKNPLKATELKNLEVVFDEATETIVFLRSCKQLLFTCLYTQ